MPGDEVIMRKEGDRIIIEPAPAKSLLAVLARLQPIDDDLGPIGDPVPDPVEI